MFTRWLILILIIFLFTAVPVSNFAYADFDKGLEAFDEGDYQAALGEWLINANQKNSDAQYNLGVMYDLGYGVPENDAEAVKWYQLAADQGDEKAQYNLVNKYARGEGVPPNLAVAVKWLVSAAGQGHAKAKVDLVRISACFRWGVQEYAYAHIRVGNGARGTIYFEVAEAITRACSRVILSNALKL